MLVDDPDVAFTLADELRTADLGVVDIVIADGRAETAPLPPLPKAASPLPAVPPPPPAREAPSFRSPWG